ncbi:MAG: hypothetical protein QW478_10650 [Candidatus Micrarchaeaceae archaeon]
MDKKILLIGAGVIAIGALAYWYLSQQPTTVNSTGPGPTTQSTQSSASSVTPTGGTGSGAGNTGTSASVTQNNNSNQVTTNVTTTQYPNQSPVVIVTTTTPTSSNSSEVSSVAVTGGYITVSPTTINRTPNTGQVITIEGYNFMPNERGYISMSNIQIGGFTASSNGTWTTTVQNTESATSTSGLWNAIQDSGDTAYIQAYGYSGTGYTNSVEVNLV